jgi:hypothetical protein
MITAEDPSNAILLTCQGLRLGSIRLPRFSLARGQAICLRLPCLSEAEDKQLEEFLTGRPANPAMHLAGRVVWVKPAQNRGGILGRFRWLRATDWLIQAGGISRAEAQSIVKQVARDPRVYIEQLAGNPRMLLALEAAYARDPEVVVFATRGCDPLGVVTIQDVVRSRLDRHSAIYLAYPFWREDVMCWSPFPGAEMVEVCTDPLQSSSGTVHTADVPTHSEKR